ncbi:hypothetical protein BH24GEM2_BH24GEM2_18270 [soil metagenome]
MARNGKRNADTVLATALAAGHTQAQAGQLDGVSPRTVARRMEEPDFRQAMREARAALMEQATGKLADATTRVADELVALLSDESATVRLSASRSILDAAGRYAESLDMTERISRVEALLAAQQPAPQPLKGRQKWVF